MKSLKVTLVPVCSLWLLSVMSSVSINGGWEQVRISIWNTNKRQFCHRNFFATIFFKPQTWKIHVSITWENVKDFVIAFFLVLHVFLLYEKHNSHEKLYVNTVTNIILKTDYSTIKINLHFISIKSKYIYILFSIWALFLPKPDRTWENTSPFGISVINTQRRDFTEKKCCFWWIVGKFSAKIIIKRSMEVA